jgi:hypothetical protein
LLIERLGVSRHRDILPWRKKVGRKNYLFLGSDNGGTAAAILYRVLASAKTNQVEPFPYVRDLPVQMSGHSPPAGAALLPDAWLTAHAEARRCWSMQLFPNGRHDDQVDAASGAFARLCRYAQQYSPPTSLRIEPRHHTVPGDFSGARRFRYQHRG